MAETDKFISRIGRLFKRSTQVSVKTSSQAVMERPAKDSLPVDEDFSAAFGFMESVEDQISRALSTASMEREPDEYELREAAARPGNVLNVADAYGISGESQTRDSTTDELAAAVRDYQEQRTRQGQAYTELNPSYTHVRPVEHAGTGPAAAVEPRGLMLRPWKRQSEALIQMQRGFSTLTDLMGTIRENLEAQNRRQDELISHLSTLPKVLDMIPEANRMQTEALKVMQSQVGMHAEQQTKLGEILERMTAAGNVQTDSIDAMKDRVESLKEHDEAISFNLNAVGAAMAAVSKNSQTSAEVLGQMKDNLGNRDVELQKILQRQGTRYTTMMSVAMVLSVGAIVAVCVFGYLILTRGQ